MLCATCPSTPRNASKKQTLCTTSTIVDVDNASSQATSHIGASQCAQRADKGARAKTRAAIAAETDQQVFCTALISAERSRFCTALTPTPRRYHCLTLYLPPLTLDNTAPVHVLDFDGTANDFEGEPFVFVR